MSYQNIDMTFIFLSPFAFAKISDETITDLMAYISDETHIDSDADAFKEDFISGRQATIRKI